MCGREGQANVSQKADDFAADRAQQEQQPGNGELSVIWCLLFDLMWCHGVPHNVNHAVSLEAVYIENLLLSMSMRVSKFEKFKNFRKQSASAASSARNCLKLQEAPRSSKAHHCELFIEQAPGITRLCYCGPRSQVFAKDTKPQTFCGKCLFRSYLCQDDGRWRLDLVDSSGWLGSCPVKWLVMQLLGWNPSRRPTDLLWYIHFLVHLQQTCFWH